MSLWYRRIISSLILLSFFFMQSVSAIDMPDAFSVIVNPNPVGVNQAADMTVKAVQADGTVVTSYVGTIVMDLDGYNETSTYDMPSDGVYAFTPEDQGVKTFSKGLVIKKSGTFTPKVFSIENDAIQGSTDVVVGSGPTGDVVDQQLIEIVSPTSGSQIQSSSINIIGKSDSKRAPLQFFIDGQKIPFEAETDKLGNFSVYPPDITSGLHSIQVKMVDFQGNVIGESPIITVDYQAPATDAFLKSFTVTPDGTINAGEKVLINAVVQDTVRSIEIRFGDMGLYPLERQSDGTFTKTIIADVPGIQKIDATLIFDGGQRQDYPDRATLDIQSVNDVGTLQAVGDSINPKRVALSWTFSGDPTSYIVRYGSSQDSLINEAKSIFPNIAIDNIDPTVPTYFQVFAVDENGLVTGKGSDIVKFQAALGSAPLTSSDGRCTVVGIKVKTEKIGDQYYLMRNSVPGATEYTIYRSDFISNSVDQMQKVGTSPIAQFAYPFDASAPHDQYAYYAVSATCADGSTLQIDNVKKVHVGPMSDMLTMIIITLLSYSLYRIYRMAR